MRGKLKTVLIVESDPTLLHTLSFILKREGHLVCLSRTVKEGMDQIHSCRLMNKKIDAAILDIQLPDGNAHEFVRRIRELDKNIPIMIIAGIGNKEMTADLLRSGCKALLRKPFTTSEMVASLRLILGEFDSGTNQISPK